VGVWEEIGQVLEQEFSDIPTAGELVRFAVRTLLACLLGGVLGWERERTGKAAGMRTHILVCLGAALFVYIPLSAGMTTGDLSRVLQGVLSGIGFLGAGAIIKMTDQGVIHGMTTAASIWLTAAVGVACGMGREVTAILGTALAFVVLAFLVRLEAALAGDVPGEDDGDGTTAPKRRRPRKD
jgi:putative Mg2+ transporter-C (MgtC) family protein